MVRYIFILSCIFVISCSPSYDESTDVRTISPNIRLVEKSQFQHSDGTLIRLSADDKQIYVSDAPSFKIIVYDHEGNLIKKLGKAGKAPWENSALWYFSKDDNPDLYWVHDFDKQLVKCYNYQTDSMISYSKIISLNNVGYIGKNRFVVPRTGESINEFFLSVHDTRKKQYTKDIDLVKLTGDVSALKPKYLSFLFNGHFSRNSNGQLLYYCLENGTFFIVNTNDYTTKMYKDIRNFPMPKAILRNQEIHLDPKYKSALSGAIDDKYVYLLTTRKQGILSSNYFLLDIYSIDKGQYMYSVEVPKLNDEQIPKSIAKVNGKVIVLYENNTIVVYEMNITPLK